MADGAQVLDLGEVIDRGRMTPVQALTAALCAAALFVDGYDIQVMALAVPSLAKAWSLPPSSFGLALSAVVIGISVGSGLIGPLGDRFGRRTMLIGAMLTIGIATACTALAATPGQFVAWRLLTGVALGAGIPSCAALTSEYAPLARRSLVMGLMNIASPVGAFAAGFIAPPVLAAFGWRGTFLIGGAAPLVVAVLIWRLAPESLKFLIIRRPSDPRIGQTLRRIAPGIDPATVRADLAKPGPKPSPLALLSPEFRALKRGGVVGGLFMSRFLDHGATRAALVVGFLLSAVCLGLFMVVPTGAPWIGLLLLLGAGVSGSQLSLNALSAAYYPPAIKATGVAWALLIGGMGSVVAPIAGAWMLEAHLPTIAILGLLAIPSVTCALGVGLMRQAWQAH
jgi:AAHS family 4-hydroxybenzoate transporter-like MFS transporter